MPLWHLDAVHTRVYLESCQGRGRSPPVLPLRTMERILDPAHSAFIDHLYFIVYSPIGEDDS